ncbi:MAG: NUDIX domain-containing protein [Ectothiorhodospiraceae bacterium]|nr:NUDIX domain-containing protein [Ectothiorhodospiraceae bacterium]
MQVDVLEKETVHNGFFRLHRYKLRHALFAGGVSETLTRELFDRGHSVGVLLYDAERDAVVLVEQFRVGALEHPSGPWLFEIVAGIQEPGATSEAVARKEALEEAGAQLQEMEHICDFLVSPGGASERVTLYCARTSVEGLGGIHGVDDEGEDIRVHVVSFDEAAEMLESGILNSAMPIIALQWLMLNRERLQDLWGA